MNDQAQEGHKYRYFFVRFVSFVVKKYKTLCILTVNQFSSRHYLMKTHPLYYRTFEK